MKQIFQLSQMPRLIMAVTLIVMIGGLFGAVVYLANTPLKINSLIINLPIKDEVSITTDKTEYEQGEDISWNSNNYKTGELFLLQESCNKTFTTGPELEEYKNGVWKRNSWVDDVLFYRSDFRLCEDAELNCARLKQDFNRIIKTKYNDFKKATNNNEVFLDTGLYRIKTTFGSSCNEQLDNEKKLENVFTVYSKEFTIKEKTTTEIDNCDVVEKNDSYTEIKEIIAESDPDYNIFKQQCVETSGCNWQFLGGKIERHYACCPDDFDDINNSDEQVQLRCGIRFD